MNSKRSSKKNDSAKHTKRTKNNADPEVFVLPPDLLQKLGINLGNMASPKVCPASENSAGVNINTFTSNTAVQDAPQQLVETPTKPTSILETAILMKNSVLLSPTFIPTGSHISGELEMSIGNDISYTEELQPNIYHSKNRVVTVEEGRTDTSNEPYQSKVSKNIVEADLSIQYPTKQAQVNCVIESTNSLLPNAIGNHQPNIDNTVIIDTKEAIVDDHQDEAYLSDCSNSNLSPIQNSNDCTYNSESLSAVCLQINKNKEFNHSDKVTILSSKTLSLSQMKKYMAKQKNTDFAPVTVNTAISIKNSNANDCTNQITENPPPTVAISDKNTDESLKNAVFDEIDAAQQLIELADLLTETVGNTDTELKCTKLMQGRAEANCCFEIDTDNIQETESQIESKDLTKNEKALDTGSIDVNSDMSIDFMVTNLDHLEENEEIIDSFVKHMDLNDSSDILESIENLGEINNTGLVSIDNTRPVSEDMYNDRNCYINDINSPGDNTSLAVDDSQSEIISIEASKDGDLKPVQNRKISNRLDINPDYQKSGHIKLNNKFCQTKLDKYFIKKQNSNVEPSAKLEDNEKISAKHNVKEIAMLLCQLNNNRHLTPTISKVPSKNTNINDCNSRFCTAKVEHPGGLHTPKEYIRNTNVCLVNNKNMSKIQTGNKNIVSPSDRSIAPKVYSRKSFTKSQNIDLKIDLNNKNPDSNYKLNNFCNCGDFGIFAYYDCNSVYEHIHFWEHRSTNCCNEDIFRIYEDNMAVNVVETYDKMDWKEEVEDSSPTHSICWNNIGIEHPENIVSEDVLVQRSFRNTFADAKQKNKAEIQQPIEKEADIQKRIKEEAEIQKPIEKKTDIQKEAVIEKPIQKEANLQQLFEKEADGLNLVEIETEAPKQSINKASDCGSHYHSQSTTKTSQINTDSKIKYIPETTDANEITNELFSKNVIRESEHVLTEQDSCSNNQVVQQETELESVVMVINDTDRDISEQTKPVPLQSSEHKDVTIEIETTKKSISNKTCDNKEDRKEKSKRKSTRRNAEQLLISETDVRKEASKNKSEKSTRNSRHFSAEGSADGDDIQKSTRNSRNFSAKEGAGGDDIQKPTKISKKVSSNSFKTEDDFPEPKRNSSRVSTENFNADGDDFEKPTTKSKRASWKGSTTEDDFQESKINSRRILAEGFSPGNDDVQKPTKKSKRISSNGCRTEEDDFQEPKRNSTRISAGGFSAEDNDFKKPEKQSKIVTSKSPRTNNDDFQETKRNLRNASSNCKANEDAPLSSIRSRKRKSSPIANETEANAGPKNKRRSSLQTEKKLVTCGVCSQNMDEVQWLNHTAKEHGYIAWKDGETPLEENDENIIQQHLSLVCKQIGSLTCSRCGFIRKSAKAFLQHKRKCGKNKTKKDKNVDTKDNTGHDEVDIKPCVKCGVCEETVLTTDWINHIQRSHEYMAWKDGESLDVNNETEVHNHLYAIAKEAGKLMCPKCGVVRIYVKKYLDHVKSCDAVRSDKNWAFSGCRDKDVYTCGVCAEKIDSQDWEEHKMIEHYNVAWIEGDMPVDKRNPYTIEKLLKEYQKQYRTFVCKICGITRASCMGFYAHVLVCGKTEEEADECKTLCSVCNKKYLSIYQVQHMGLHRSAESIKERQAIIEEEKRKNDEKALLEESSYTPGKRKAAQKAIAVIENYKTENQKCKHICKTCGFGTDTVEDLKLHKAKCMKSEKDSDVIDTSIEGYEESSSSDEFSEIDSDSNVSVEIEDDSILRRRRKKHKRNYDRDQDNTMRFPRISNDPKKFLLKSGDEFCKYHLSGENLFPDWRTCEYEAVVQEDVFKYMDPLEKSCNVKLNDRWTTFSKFEAKKEKGYSLFVGLGIRCVSWAPPADGSSSNYLAVACHRGMDCPRLAADHTPAYPGVIQIWDFGQFDSLPQFKFGLAHDHGTVWALDWCPSGAQDPMPDVKPECLLRMGLLATACSNGSAYIYCVPQPSTFVQEEKSLYKLKPVVELRLSMVESERKSYQASSLRWSMQKGHSLIVVGYGDGTTAYYDLNINSPLLKTKENDITIIYPYHDERLLQSCVAAVDICPSMEEGLAAGAVCGGGATGAVATLGVDTTSRLALRNACHAVLFEPLWPAAMLISDTALTVRSTATELEWSGKGRCVGGGGAGAGCVRCGRSALYAAPLVRLLRPHPIAFEEGRKTLGSLLTVDLKEQKKRKAKDEFAIVIEPTTYEKAIQVYGIEFKQDRSLQPTLVTKSRDTWSQRYPLGDIVSMTFCPAAAHHNRLAIATFAGIVFVVDAS